MTQREYFTLARYVRYGFEYPEFIFPIYTRSSPKYETDYYYASIDDDGLICAFEPFDLESVPGLISQFVDIYPPQIYFVGSRANYGIAIDSGMILQCDGFETFCKTVLTEGGSKLLNLNPFVGLSLAQSCRDEEGEFQFAVASLLTLRDFNHPFMMKWKKQRYFTEHISGRIDRAYEQIISGNSFLGTGPAAHTIPRNQRVAVFDTVPRELECGLYEIDGKIFNFEKVKNRVLKEGDFSDYGYLIARCYAYLGGDYYFWDRATVRKNTKFIGLIACKVAESTQKYYETHGVDKVCAVADDRFMDDIFQFIRSST
jgi:hypothetical protein